MEERTVLESPAPLSGYSVSDATQLLTPGPGVSAYSDATQQAIARACPVCNTPNPPQEPYCQDCGLLFSSVAGAVEPLPDAASSPRAVDGESGQEFLLNPGVNLVGREGGELLLGHPTVSRRHAQWTLEDNRLWVEDMGSSNGTSVGARRVSPGERVEVFEGDVVKHGSVRLTVHLPGSGQRPLELPPPAAPAESPAERGAPVACLVGPDGREHAVFLGENTLGRRSGNQIVISDAFMSGRHADILCMEDGSAQLTDIGSTNGSFLDGQRLAPNAPVLLGEGTAFTLGKTRFTYRIGAPTGGAADERTEMLSTFETVRGEDPASAFETVRLPPSSGGG